MSCELVELVELDGRADIDLEEDGAEGDDDEEEQEEVQYGWSGKRWSNIGSDRDGS